MHDPMVVVCHVPAPWLRRSYLPGRPARPRWGLVAHRRTNPENLGERVYPWWRPAGYELVLAGGKYRPRTLATVWHVEPRERDSGEVCDVRGWWRWHVHHWRLQFPPLQELRRTLLTRCSWCGGRHRRCDPVNTSNQWDGPRGRWWQGEPGLFHGDCSVVASAHATCACSEPGSLAHGDYGTCATCGRFRPWRPADDPDHYDDITRALQTVPVGQRRSAEVEAWVDRITEERAR